MDAVEQAQDTQHELEQLQDSQHELEQLQDTQRELRAQSQRHLVNTRVSAHAKRTGSAEDPHTR